MIELTAISKTFNAGKPNQFTALEQIDLTLEPGRVAVFKGPSGSGKTTLLGIIGCMARPTAGRLRIQGREVNRLPERFLSRIRRESFGFVFQSFNLVTGVSVLFPQFRLTPHAEVYLIVVVLFLSVVPYMMATIVPSWKAAVTDPDMVMRT